MPQTIQLLIPIHQLSAIFPSAAFNTFLSSLNLKIYKIFLKISFLSKTYINIYILNK